MIGPARQGDPLKGNIDPGVVHQGEHGAKPLPRRSQKLGLGPVKHHVACGRGMKPHLVLDPGHPYRITPLADLGWAQEQA